jgi:peptidyl-prolyl cis-trans isomerase B (cyclophilin B)
MAGLMALVAVGQQANPPKFLPRITREIDSQGIPNEPGGGDKVAVLETSLGRVVIMFLPGGAPNHVTNFKALAEKKFYDGSRFHRCIPGFMVQGGDPYTKQIEKSSAWGTGGNVAEDGTRVTVAAEFNNLRHLRGIVSMARSSDPDSASSQFFIVTSDSSFLDHKYTAFGKVVRGMDVVDKIVATGDANANGRVKPEEAVVLKSVTIQEWPLKS